MSSPEPLAESQPLCATHVDARSAFVCTRCGSFGCDDCRISPRSALCKACAAREQQGEYTFSALVSDARSVFQRNLRGVGVLLIVLSLIELSSQFVLRPLFGLGAEVELPWPRKRALSLGMIVFGLHSAAHAGFMRWVADGILDGASRSVGAVAKAAVNGFFSLSIAGLLFGVIAGVGFMLFIFPGVYLAICMSLAPAAVVVGGLSAHDAINHSYKIVKGHRLTLALLCALLLLMLLCARMLAMLIGGILGILAGGVGSAMSAILERTAATLPLLWFSIATTLVYLRITGRARGIELARAEGTLAGGAMEAGAEVARAPRSNVRGRRWRWWLMGVAAVVCSLVVARVFSKPAAREEWQLFMSAVMPAVTSPKVQEILGAPIRPGWGKRGNVTIEARSGLRYAIITAPLDGPVADGHMRAKAEEVGGRWKLTLLVVEVPGHPDIDVLGDAPPGGP